MQVIEARHEKQALRLFSEVSHKVQLPSFLPSSSEVAAGVAPALVVIKPFLSPSLGEGEVEGGTEGGRCLYATRIHTRGLEAFSL